MSQQRREKQIIGDDGQQGIAILVMTVAGVAMPALSCGYGASRYLA